MDVGELTTSRKDQGKETVSPMSSPDLWGHCIFCVRKVSPNPVYRTSDYNLSGSEKEYLTVVPPADLSSSAAKSLQILNIIWPFLKKKGDGENADQSLKQILTSESGSDLEESPHSVLPPICQFCAEEFLQLEEMVTAVRLRVRVLRKIIRDSQNGGRYSWRRVNFEKDLKRAGLEDQEVTTTLGYWDDLGDPSEQGEEDIEIPYETDRDNESPAGRDSRTKFESTVKVAVESDSRNLDAEETGEDPQDDMSIKFEQHDSGGDSGSEEASSLVSGRESEQCFQYPGSSPRIQSGDPLAIVEGRDDDVPMMSEEPPGDSTAGDRGCPPRFKSDSLVPLPLKRCHRSTPAPSPSRTCGCGKVFSCPSKLIRHQTGTRCSQRPGDTGRVTQKCYLCGMTVNLRDMLEHTRAHVGDFTLLCPNAPQCPFVFSHSGLIKTHVNAKCKFNKSQKRKPTSAAASSSSSYRGAGAETYLYTCETCGYESYNRLVFRTHLDQIHERVSAKNYTCPVAGCGATFSVRQSVDIHLSVHKFQEVALQQCDLCPERVAAEKMKEHLSGVHGKGDLLSCPQCPLVFWERIPFVEHQHVHRHLGFFCDLCGRDVQFSRHGDLKNHFETEHQVQFPRFVCESCGCDYSSKNSLDSHKRTKHSKAPGPEGDNPDGDGGATRTTRASKSGRQYICEECLEPVSFSCLSLLTTHRIQRHGVKPLECKTCGEQFPSRTRLLHHKKAEHERTKRKWPCDVPGCRRRYDSERKLKLHLCKGHPGKSLCSECGKAFATKQRLKEHHDFVHLGLRPAVCEICGEAFGSSAVLKVHKLIHTEERPFECEFCGQGFRQKDVLGRHLRSHTEKGASFQPHGPMHKIRKRKTAN